MRIELPTDRIENWHDFHEACAETLQFFEGYGHNMNAWIDCMTDWTRDGHLGLMQLDIPDGDDLVLVLPHSDALTQRMPDLVDALWHACGAVNLRFAQANMSCRLLLAPS